MLQNTQGERNERQDDLWNKEEWGLPVRGRLATRAIPTPQVVNLWFSDNKKKKGIKEIKK